MENNGEIIEEKHIWGIHTPEINEDLFLQKSTLAIGWKEIGDLSNVEKNRDAFREKYVSTYPDAKKGNIAVNSGTLFRFTCEMQIGDYVVFPSKSDRMINIGIVDSNYIFNGEAYHYVHQRKVKWLKHLPRTAFSQGALYETGSLLTLFTVKNYASEFLTAIEKNIVNDIPEEDESVAVTADEIQENTTDYIIKEISRQLKGYDFEDFVANVLEAMGYKTKISQHGGDGGRDIIAYQGELQLPPRIVVQAKSQDSNISSSLVRDLKGAMREGDYGFFVALSDYSKDAKEYLEQNPIIRGINGVQFVKLFLEYYDKLDEKYRDMFPLKKVYIPIQKESKE